MTDETEARRSNAEQHDRDPAPRRYVEVGSSRHDRPADPAAANAKPGEDMPSDVGRRASVDEKTGEVHGSGAGAVGGTEHEDFDRGTSGGGDPAPS